MAYNVVFNSRFFVERRSFGVSDCIFPRRQSVYQSISREPGPDVCQRIINSCVDELERSDPARSRYTADTGQLNVQPACQRVVVSVARLDGLKPVTLRWAGRLVADCRKALDVAVTDGSQSHTVHACSSAKKKQRACCMHAHRAYQLP